ncbi:uncharacterized protein N7484_008179 [Penicillium longicatenatum]|uniref:uncharacterized protein n=1 Tax=Penicillium longicatenatum TaxID=1561947 RepID=UPI002547BF1F|nr:uncharacterized protein N7484_008179 [Penicillium longicatenatum]KAJ5640317.1 hypothetical protein N7484_008179 [Penicillium longicatenatum]
MTSLKCRQESKESNQSDKRPWKIIEVGGVPNLRGFGGYPTELSRSHKTRKMFLYRSAHPGRLTEAGLNKLKDMGIKNIIDLTSDNETVVNYNISLERLTNEGLLRISCPLKRGLFSIDELLSRYGNYTTKDCEVKSISKRYVGLLEEGAETVRKILSILCSNPRSATLIHCSLGKDRTGIIFALLLLLAGVPDPLIAMEYSVSTEGLKGSVVDIEKFLRENTNSDALSRARALEMATAK